MGKTRLEAFSDAVIAIILTIMVLELRPPHGFHLAELRPLLPVFLAYVLSFVYLGIYWNNHHHMVHTVRRVTGGMLWANLHLLFWLSLVPFTTHWVGEHPTESAPTALYAFVLLMSALAYTALEITILRAERSSQERSSQERSSQDGSGSVLARAIGKDLKGKLSPVLYTAAFALAFVAPLAAQLLFVAVALMWLVPDRRIERALATESSPEQ